MDLLKKIYGHVKYMFNIGCYRDLQETLKHTDWVRRKEMQRKAQEQWLNEIKEKKQADIVKRLQEYLNVNHDNFYGYKPLEIQGIIYYMVGKFEKIGRTLVDCKITVLGPHWTENPGWVSASGDFSECKIHDIQVKNWEQHKGFGSAMLSYLIEILKTEGCSRIVGELISTDLERQPWLPEFYSKKRFQVEFHTGGYIFKNL